MLREPAWPLFVLDGNDVMVVHGVDEIEAFLADGPAALFDSMARPVRLVVEGRVRKWWLFGIDDRKTVGVEVVNDDPQADRLRSAVTTYLRSAGTDVPEDRDIEVFCRRAAPLVR